MVINTHDGTSKFKVRLRIHRENGDVVETTNAAVAVSSCVDCRTAAVSFQVLLLDDDADTITPTNLAIAINEGCSDCETLASAYQYVLSTDGHVRFSKAGQQELIDIRQDLKRLRKNDELSLDEVQQRLDRLSDRLLVVLTHELIIQGPDDEPIRPFGDAVGENGEPLELPESNTTTTTTSTTLEPTPSTEPAEPTTTTVP